MKRILICLGLSICLALSFLPAQETSTQEEKNPEANISIVNETAPPPEQVKEGFDSITGHDAMAYLRFISSDLLEGRDTARPGYAIAAEYVSSMFELWGIKPAGDFLQPTRARGMRFMPPSPDQQQDRKRGYFQNIVFREWLSTKGKAVVEWQKGKQKKSQTFLPDQDYNFSLNGSQTLTAPVVFVGYGIKETSLKFDEYKDIDVKGKFVMMLNETPRAGDPESPFNEEELKEKYNPPRRMRRMSDPKTKLAIEMGAEAIILVENRPDENGDIPATKLPRPQNDEQPIIPGERRRISLVEGGNMPMPWESLPTCRISREMANAILGYSENDVDSLKAKIEKDMEPQSFELPGVTLTLSQTAESKLVQCHNVLGFIEGSDPELKDEVIVIGAHLDHLGQRGEYIYNGADDNGSGSVGVMECAEAFALNSAKPKRSILFALWTGEEKGLLGSRYYVNHPYFPIENTVACLNLDMISRTYTKQQLQMMASRLGEDVPKDALDKVDAQRFVRPSFSAQTPELREIMKNNNQYVGLSMFLSETEGGGGGSDHAPFAYADRPWVFFFAAMTDDYHRPSDSVEKVSASLMERIIRMTYLTAFDLADR